MIATPDDLRAVLADTPFRDAECVRIAMPGAFQHALAMRVVPEDALQAWHLLRGRIEATGRWPVVTAAWTGNGPWAKAMAEADFFNRFEFGNGSPGKPRPDTSAKAILARSQDVAIEDFERAEAGYWDDNIDEFIDFNLDAMRLRHGSAPTHEEAARAAAMVRRSRDRAVERWLLDWEIARVGLPRLIEQTDMGYQDWFDPAGQPMALLLMPFTRGADLLAHMHWFGAGSSWSEFAIAFLRHWEDRYGAELVAHFGTMLQLLVRRRPADIDEAFELASAHDAFAPCTLALPGVALRDHAKAVLKADRWFLHERP